MGRQSRAQGGIPKPAPEPGRSGPGRPGQRRGQAGLRFRQAFCRQWFTFHKRIPHFFLVKKYLTCIVFERFGLNGVSSLMAVRLLRCSPP